MGSRMEEASGSADDNSRNIPRATFIEDIAGHVQGKDIQAIMKAISEVYGKYKFMEGRLVQQKRSLLGKMPDIRRAIDVLEMLIEKHKEGEENGEIVPVEMRYKLADNVFGRATVNPGDGKVMLWIGANIMMEYSYEEAMSLLQKNLESASATYASLDIDLAFLKDQITISEVNIARLHNYNVAQKEKAKVAAVSS
ncbi:Prefoldin subunit 3 [Plasmodiophora brassicae]